MSESDPPPTLPVPRSSERRPLRWLALLVVLPSLGAVLGLVVGVVASYITPRKYESTAVVQIHPRVQELSPFSGTRADPGPGGAASAQFMANEFEVIRARETLKRVVDRLDLCARWNGLEVEEVLEVLSAIVHTEQIHGTDLVKVVVRHTNPADARDIAQSVVDAYQERRLALEADRATRALNALDSERRDQEDFVEEKRKLLHTIVQAIGTPYIEGERGAGGLGKAESEALLHARRELAKLKAEKERLEVEIKTVLKFDSEALLGYATARGKSPQLSEIRKRFMKSANELEVQKAQFGEDHPEIRRLTLEKELIQSELAKGVETYRVNLQIDLEMNESRLEETKQIVNRHRDRAVDVALDSQDYLETKREYEAARAMLESMRLQLSSSRIALKIPKNPVTIHEMPTIAKHPAGPPTGRLALLGMLGGVGVGLLVALPISGLMVARG